jgi:hypothetical protein
MHGDRQNAETSASPLTATPILDKVEVANTGITTARKAGRPAGRWLYCGCVAGLPARLEMVPAYR